MTFRMHNNYVTVEDTMIVCSREIHSRFYTICINVKDDETLRDAKTKITNVTSLNDELFVEFANLGKSDTNLTMH